MKVEVKKEWSDTFKKSKYYVYRGTFCLDSFDSQEDAITAAKEYAKMAPHEPEVVWTSDELLSK